MQVFFAGSLLTLGKFFSQCAKNDEFAKWACSVSDRFL